MPFAINVRSDDESAEAIRALWRRLEAFEETPSMRMLNYPPHLTLGIYADVTERELFSAVDDVRAEVLTLRFEAFGCFTPPGGLIVWAAPRVNRQLRRLHQTVHELIDADRCHPNYRPGRWVPHCTLALSIAAEHQAQVRALTEEPLPPFSVTFDVMDCTSYHPVEVLRERRLT
jgi:2'-5' RNA ligase